MNMKVLKNTNQKNKKKELKKSFTKIVNVNEFLFSIFFDKNLFVVNSMRVHKYLKETETHQLDGSQKVA